jgi:hypothetical protein
MGVRHVVLFRWKDDVTEKDLAELRRRLAALPEAIPELRAYSFGADLGINPGTADFAIVADTDDEQGHAAYRDHPQHREVVSFISTLVAERQAVQYAF